MLRSNKSVASGSAHPASRIFRGRELPCSCSTNSCAREIVRSRRNLEGATWGATDSSEVDVVIGSTHREFPIIR
jgi:hypothetical protein